MSSDQTTPPLEPLEAAGAYDAPVVDLAGYRVRSGRTPWKAEKDRCKHTKVIYSTTERRVWCEACQSPVDAFDGLMTVVHHFEDMEREARRRIREAEDGARAVIVRRGAKEIDRSWGHKMAPCCPHCRRGLMPQDFANGAGSSVGFEYESARRQRGSRDAD